MGADPPDPLNTPPGLPGTVRALSYGREVTTLTQAPVRTAAQRAAVRDAERCAAEAVGRAAEATLALRRATARELPTFPDTQELLASGRLLAGVQARTLFWPRQELAAAQERWPELLEGDVEAYYWGLEHSWREVRGRSGRNLVLVPARVEPLAAHAEALGESVTESSTRHSYLQARHELGDVASWPPARNDCCWCGSGAKYKKCCARG